MINYIKKYKYLFIIAILLFIFGVPFLINCLYKIYQPNTFFTAEWRAGELLAYYGSVLSFIGTISLGILVILQNQIIEQKSDEFNKMLLKIETQKNTPRLKCSYQSGNGYFTNSNFIIENVSENIATKINASDFLVYDELNTTIIKSTQFKLDKDTLYSRDIATLSFTNERFFGKNLTISFVIFCTDKYDINHTFRVFGFIPDAESSKTIKMEEIK